MTRENKGTTMCLLPIQRMIIKFLYFFFHKWENSKKKKSVKYYWLILRKASTFVQLIWGTLYNYQRLKILSHAARWCKRGRQPWEGESGAARERYLKVSPACLLSFLELLSKRRENQRLDFICWKKWGKKKSSKIKLALFLTVKWTSYRSPLGIWATPVTANAVSLQFSALFS